tara:strand:+ start:6330 stop:6929 length:600 start_codon:yes stop_codon:yes gene_type:complete
MVNGKFNMVNETLQRLETPDEQSLARLHEGLSLPEMHECLGIPPDYAEITGLIFFAEPESLAIVGEDCFGRLLRLEPTAREAWEEMRSAAAGDGVDLLPVSGFRSHYYQADLLRRKIRDGRALSELLTVNAAPGYSEHHSGRALDITTVDTPPLQTQFEETGAFAWLQKNAAQFQFSLSYPKERSGIISYEPWHWCFNQ